MKRVGERFGKPLVAIGATAALIAGCGEEVSGTEQRSTEVVSTTLFEQTPEGVDPAAWCGFVAAREVVRRVAGERSFESEKTYYGENQSWVEAKSTSIGYVVTLEATLGNAQYSVRGQMAVASSAGNPLAALDAASVKNDVTFDPDAPIAVWDLQDNEIGGTTNEPATICQAADDTLELLGK